MFLDDNRKRRPNNSESFLMLDNLYLRIFIFEDNPQNSTQQNLAQQESNLHLIRYRDNPCSPTRKQINFEKDVMRSTIEL